MILANSSLYLVESLYKEKKILADMPDGGKAMIKHKSLEITFRHKRTRDTVEFKVTGQHNCFQNGKQIHIEDFKNEFIRLLDSRDQASEAMQKVQLCLIMGL